MWVCSFILFHKQQIALVSFWRLIHSCNFLLHAFCSAFIKKTYVILIIFYFLHFLLFFSLIFILGIACLGCYKKHFKKCSSCLNINPSKTNVTSSFIASRRWFPCFKDQKTLMWHLVKWSSGGKKRAKVAELKVKSGRASVFSHLALGTFYHVICTMAPTPDELIWWICTVRLFKILQGNMSKV